MTKVKAAIIEHSRYRETIKSCFRGWRAQLKKKKMALSALQQIDDKYAQRVFMEYLKHKS